MINSFLQSLNVYMISFLHHQNINQWRPMCVIEGLQGVETCQFAKPLYHPKQGFSKYLTQSSVQDLLCYLCFVSFCICLLLQNKFGAGLAWDFKGFFQEITFQGEYKKFIFEMNSCELLFWSCLLFRTFYNIKKSLSTGKYLPVFKISKK